MVPLIFNISVASSRIPNIIIIIIIIIIIVFFFCFFFIIFFFYYCFFFQKKFQQMCIYICKETGFLLEQFKRLLLFGCYVKIQSCSKYFLNMLLSVYRISVFKRRLIAHSRGFNMNIVRLFQHYMRSYFNSLVNQYPFQNKISVFENKYIKNSMFLKMDTDQLIFKYPLEN